MVKSTGTRRTKKPEKPYHGFPLFAHATKRWAKKIQGKLWYFGSWADGWQKALDRFQSERDDIFAGRNPRAPKVDGYLLGTLANDYLNSKRAALEHGAIRARHFRDLYGACARMVSFFGAGRLVKELGPDDFEALGYSYPKKWKLRRRKREITTVRAVFRYALKKEKIERLRFGTFEAPSTEAIDAERNMKECANGDRAFTPKQLRDIIHAAPVPFRAMVLLGVNCGYGNTDIATLPLSFLDLDAGWAGYPRLKTSIKRRAKLWPETVAALRQAVAHRPAPADPVDERLVFLTPYGAPWVRCSVSQDERGVVAIKSDDQIQKKFRILLSRLKVKRVGLSFYSLRHCTESFGGTDQIAIDRVMGHKSRGMGTNYRTANSVSDDRLRGVAAALHAWLFGKTHPS
jgi:integrase